MERAESACGKGTPRTRKGQEMEQVRGLVENGETSSKYSHLSKKEKTERTHSFVHSFIHSFKIVTEYLMCQQPGIY